MARSTSVTLTEYGFGTESIGLETAAGVGNMAPVAGGRFAARSGPTIPWAMGTVRKAGYTCGYSDRPEDLPADGQAPLPDGPGLGVGFDRDFIRAHKSQEMVFE